MPSRDGQWIIGAIVGAVLALSVQIGGIRTELRVQVAALQEDLRRMDDRLRAVEVEFGKVDQRLATLERLPADSGSG